MILGAATVHSAQVLNPVTWLSRTKMKELEKALQKIGLLEPPKLVEPLKPLPHIFGVPLPHLDPTYRGEMS